MTTKASFLIFSSSRQLPPRYSPCSAALLQRLSGNVTDSEKIRTTLRVSIHLRTFPSVLLPTVGEIYRIKNRHNLLIWLMYLYIYPPFPLPGVGTVYIVRMAGH